MNTLVVVGTSAAYFYSAVAALAPQLFAGGMGVGVYFDTSALIDHPDPARKAARGAREGPHERGHKEARRPRGEDGAGGA